MKRLTALLLCVLMLTASLPFCVSADTDNDMTYGGYSGSVISTNGGFENVTDGVADGTWVMPEGALVTNDASGAFEGTNYVKFDADAMRDLVFNYNGTPGKHYLMRGYYKQLDGGTNTSGMALFMYESESGTAVRTTNYNISKYSESWIPFAQILDVNTTKTGEITFRIRNWSGNAALCLDNIEIIELDGVDTNNIIQNPGFEFDALSTGATDTIANWNNGGNTWIVADGHTGNRAMEVRSGQTNAYAFVPGRVNTGGNLYELSAWVKWSDGDNHVAGVTEGITAPVIGVESFTVAGVKIDGADFSFTKEQGIEGSNWSFVKMILPESFTPATLASFRVYVKKGSGTTIWDDICLKSVNTSLAVFDENNVQIDILPEAEDAVYTAYAQCPGINGKLFIAEYKKNADSELQLMQYDILEMNSNGETAVAAIDGVTTLGDGSTVVKAFLWDENLSPIKTVMISDKKPVVIPDTELIVNGDFSAGAADSTQITGWTQTNTDNQFYMVSANGEKYVRVDVSDIKVASGIKQSVNINETDAWYMEYANYKYMLSYDAFASGSVFRGYVNVTVTGKGGTQVTMKYESTPESDKMWKWSSLSHDLSALVDGIGNQPVKSIDIELVGQGSQEYMSFDNVSLKAVYSPSNYRTNLFSNGDFEQVSGNVAVGVTALRDWDGTYASLVTDNVQSGDYAAKLTSGNNVSYIEFDADGLFYSTTYNLSFWYKGDVAEGENLDLRMYTYYTDSESGAVYQRYTDTEIMAGGTSVGEWKQFIHGFKLAEGTKLKIRMFLKSGQSTVYIDNVSLIREENAPVASVSTDEVFYYTENTQNGETGTATVELSAHYAGKGYSADIKLTDGSSVLTEKTNVSFADGKATFTYPLSLLSEKQKEYTVEAEIIDEEYGETVYTAKQPIYKYDRPSSVSKNGTYTDINGKKVEPVFMYGIAREDWAAAAELGVNVVQYVSKATLEETISDLDYLYSLGMYAAYVSYWEMYPAGNEINYTRVQEMVGEIKSHPAIFAYMVMDEPFLNRPGADTSEDLRKSYIMLRTADPARPTFICEGAEAYMNEVSKYCDIIAPDPYPGIKGDNADMAKDVAVLVESAARGVNYDKPVISILQAFTYGGVKPTSTELHSMIYQSLLAGGNYIGFYMWTVNDSDGVVIEELFAEDEYKSMQKTFYEEEQSILYNYFGINEGTKISEEKGADAPVWYESWNDGDNIYIAMHNRSDDAETTADIPVSVSGTAQVIGNGDNSAIIGTEAGTLSIKLAPCQALLIKIVQ